MEDQLARVGEDLLARVSGPLHLRLFIQPAVALFFGIRDGLRDARHGSPAYFWAIFSDRSHRRALVREGWASVGKVFLFALALDVVFQLAVLRTVYPGEALVVGLLLTVLPYLLLRGPTNRIARSLQPRRVVPR